MLKVRKLHLLLASIALSSVACSSLPVDQTGTAVPAGKTVQPTVAIGTVIDLPKGNTLNARRARLLDEYHSASGKLCRRVMVEIVPSVERVLCLQDDGQWRFTRSLLPGRANRPRTIDSVIKAPLLDSATDRVELMNDEQIPREPDLASAQPQRDSVVNVSDGEWTKTERMAPMQLKMNAGETLWHFSLRTTGKAENWKVLAQINAIADVSRIPRGATLSVPVDLYAGGL